MLSFGSAVNWVEPNGNYGQNYCIQCGRKTGKKAYKVNIDTGGFILNPSVTVEGGSQGFWDIGSECAKKFDPAVLVK